MVKIKRYSFVIGRFMSGPNGQRFFNIAYSVGAAIVILGALFKILHVTGGDTLLAVGMGTEVLMFILTAFERPASEYHQAPVQGGIVAVSGNESIPASTSTPAQVTENSAPGNVSGQNNGTGTIIIQGGFHSASGEKHNVTTEREVDVANVSPIDAKLSESISENVKTIDESMHSYIESMADLNRNITGLNTIYELQLKTASSQLNTMEFAGRSMSEMQKMYEGTAEKSQIFQQEAQKLTENMKKLNEVYENMLRAMNVEK